MTNHLVYSSSPEITQHDGRIVVARDWRFVNAEGGYCVVVPQGFVTDLASVPRLAWVLISPMDLTFAAPILHDYLYAHRGTPPPGDCYPSDKTFTRAEADRLFYELMAEEGVTLWRRTVAYLAVRVGGWFAWR